MSGRRGSGGFSSTFSRRPVAGGGSDGSLLGDPPRRGQQQQLYDPFAESERDSGRSYGRDSYDRGGGSGYVTGTYSSSSSAQLGYGQGQSGRGGDYGTPSQSQFSTPVVVRERVQDASSTWRRRSPSPPPHHHTDSGYSRTFISFKNVR